MTRSYVDCRELPSEVECSIAISADREEEAIEAAVQHAVSVHKHHDTPGLRGQLRQVLRKGPLP